MSSKSNWKLTKQISMLWRSLHWLQLHSSHNRGWTGQISLSHLFRILPTQIWLCTTEALPTADTEAHHPMCTRKPVDTSREIVFGSLRAFYRCFWLLILCQRIISVYKVNPQYCTSFSCESLCASNAAVTDLEIIPGMSSSVRLVQTCCLWGSGEWGEMCPHLLQL